MATERLFAYLSYKDALQALDWLQRAFKFELVSRVLSDDGSAVQHAELKLGDAVVMVNQ